MKRFAYMLQIIGFIIIIISCLYGVIKIWADPQAVWSLVSALIGFSFVLVGDIIQKEIEEL